MEINAINNQTFAAHPATREEIKTLKSAIEKGKAFLYDVDTTHGFMDQTIHKRPNGITDGFPVIGATLILPALAAIKSLFAGKLPKVESVDAHSFSDPEIKFFKNVSDIHSQKGTFGAEKIKETVFGEPNLLIEVEPEKQDVPNVADIQKTMGNNGIIRIEKNEIDILKYGDSKTGNVIENKKGVDFFNNLKNAGANVALVYGVAEEYCVKAAVAACKRFGITPIVINDAVKDAGTKALQDNNDEVYGDVATITTKELANL
ncbi:MAG: isochorismatase family protein [bacterium]|nr:isochorismatase family protein [bacterium]